MPLPARQPRSLPGIARELRTLERRIRMFWERRQRIYDEALFEFFPEAFEESHRDPEAFEAEQKADLNDMTLSLLRPALERIADELASTPCAHCGAQLARGGRR